MSERQRQEATSPAELQNAEGPNRYVSSTDAANPNIVHVAGTNETLNLKPVMVDAKTLEPPFQKLVRKVKQEPLVPIFLGLTIGAITMAMVELRRGNKRQLQKWLRYRVVYQTATVAAVLVGSAYYKDKKSAAGPDSIPDEALTTARLEADNYDGTAPWERRLAELEASKEQQAERERQNRELIMAQLIAQDQAREAARAKTTKLGIPIPSSSSSGSEEGAPSPEQASKGSHFLHSFNSLFGGKKEE